MTKGKVETRRTMTRKVRDNLGMVNEKRKEKHIHSNNECANGLCVTQHSMQL